ncbi:MAG: TetR/AcrR family transcriptional regulator [Acidihalobacter sp.]
MDRRTDTRQRILATARGLMHARSYTDVGVAEICTEAGVRKGSFYHFFPSKRDLALALLEQILDDFRLRLLDEAFDPVLSPMQRIDKWIELTYAVQQEWASSGGHVLGCPVGNLATELATQDEVLRVAIEQAFESLQERLIDTLKEAERSGELADVDAGATSQAMLAYLEGVLMLAKTSNDTGVIARLLPALRDIRIPKAAPKT